ncbi:hypothetical protein ERJ75_001633900 [Trypanosoma vivax]|nr:hypothetical protein ERJ75_001634100 [Trypanosoma vivax]KAH8605270.1 hypothetical protein ERJ75_001633700 [Trypanosoma vivax]KAH8605271.1 hypothetical protein ERJ75_001633900 [Trypanosoma vivax]
MTAAWSAKARAFVYRAAMPAHATRLIRPRFSTRDAARASSDRLRRRTCALCRGRCVNACLTLRRRLLHRSIAPPALVPAGFSAGLCQTCSRSVARLQLSAAASRIAFARTAQHGAANGPQRNSSLSAARRASWPAWRLFAPAWRGRQWRARKATGQRGYLEATELPVGASRKGGGGETDGRGTNLSRALVSSRGALCVTRGGAPRVHKPSATVRTSHDSGRRPATEGHTQDTRGKRAPRGVNDRAPRKFRTSKLRWRTATERHDTGPRAPPAQHTNRGTCAWQAERDRDRPDGHLS